ncbi:MAG TPA: sialidase family protein, partial [Candidatus Dormibacteraeota bacterium]|nr:sialidase family protein [Candidatus Dormibacteraeota bacterium]
MLNRRRFIWLAVCGLISYCAAALSANLRDSVVPVFVAGEDGYSCYRIPSLLTTKTGTLLAVADGRLTNCADIPNPLDLVLKRSLDHGKTWTGLQ